MPKKMISGFAVLKNQDLSASFDTFSQPTNIDFLDNLGIILTWTTGGTPVGVFEVWVSNKEKDIKPAVQADYTKLDFGAVINISSVESEHIISMNQLPFSWFAVKYVRTSGSGFITAKITSKEI